MSTDPKVLVSEDIGGGGERVVWYSIDGLEKPPDDGTTTRHAIVHEIPGKPPEYLCQGLLTWSEAYHYFAAFLTGLDRGRGRRRSWPDINNLVANATQYEARFYSFERAKDVHKVEDAAVAAGFETYPYRRDLVVVDPETARPSTMTEAQRRTLETESEDA